MGNRLGGGLLGPDPAGSHDAPARAAAEVFRRPGALAGPLPVRPGASSRTHFLALLGRAG